MKKIRIINLGDIITPQIMKTLAAFAEKLAVTIPAIGEVLTKQKTLIDQFKLGTLTDGGFTKQMIVELEKVSGKKLTPEEFDHAWNTMNPLFSEFKDGLAELVENNIDQQIILVSASNPKDIAHLTHELTANGQQVTLDANAQLSHINGIPLYLSYVRQETKPELVASIIKMHSSNHSPSQFTPAATDIKYIYKANNLSDAALKPIKDELDKINTLLSKTVETIIWDKELSEALKKDNASFQPGF